MEWITTALLAMAPSAPPGTQQNPKGQLLHLVGMFLIIGFTMYFLVFRPQQKRVRDQSQLATALKTGDKVITHSGIVGVIVGVKDKTISIRSADTKLEVLKSAVSEIVKEKNEGQPG